MFDHVRIINLVDRPDRRRETVDQLNRVGGVAPDVAFYDASPMQYYQSGERVIEAPHSRIT